MKLYNTLDSRLLKEAMRNSQEVRTTISFYKYVPIKNPAFFRDFLYIHFTDLAVLGRVYLAAEGINAQISVPEQNLGSLQQFLDEISFFHNLRLNYAIDDDGKSFFKLSIKVRLKIVADGLDFDLFAKSGPAPYLNAVDFNTLADNPETVIVDMRNHYESEIGRFKNAYCPDVDTFREQLPMVANHLMDRKDKTIIMYCTGGIRCEKASAYLKYRGFSKVYHVEGGIIKYSRDAKALGLPNKFIGKNFVFDERLSECVTDDVIASCHQCGEPYDQHTNCRNKACNQLLIQCPSCAARYEGCCSDDCRTVASLPEEEQKKLRKGKDSGRRIFVKGRYQL